jgi:hypothetical protein
MFHTIRSKHKYDTLYPCSKNEKWKQPIQSCTIELLVYFSGRLYDHMHEALGSISNKPKTYKLFTQ